jgi:hypothetical protein
MNSELSTEAQSLLSALRLGSLNESYVISAYGIHALQELASGKLISGGNFRNWKAADPERIRLNQRGRTTTELNRY